MKEENKKTEIKEPEKGYNLQVYELEEQIMNAITQSGLPAVVQNYIIQNVANRISLAARNIIDSERYSFIIKYKEFEKNNKEKTEK